jgi:transposase-like protein
MTTSSPRARSRSRRWSPAEKAHHLIAFRRSGLTIRQYAAGAGVPRSTFELWRREARRAHRATRPVRSRFAQVEVAPSASLPITPTLTVRSASGVALEIGGLDARALAQLVRALVVPPADA